MNWNLARSTLLSLIVPVSLGACSAPVGPSGPDMTPAPGGKADFNRPTAQYEVEPVEIQAGFRYRLEGDTLRIVPDKHLLDMLAGQHSQAPLGVKRGTLYVRPDSSFEKKVEFKRDAGAQGEHDPWHAEIDFAEWAGEGTFVGTMKLATEIEFALPRELDREGSRALRAETYTSRGSTEVRIRDLRGDEDPHSVYAAPIELWDHFVYASMREMLDETWTFEAAQNDEDCYGKCRNFFTVRGIDLNGGARVPIVVPKAVAPPFVSVQPEGESRSSSARRQTRIASPGVFDLVKEPGPDTWTYPLKPDTSGGE